MFKIGDRVEYCGPDDWEIIEGDQGVIYNVGFIFMGVEWSWGYKSYVKEWYLRQPIDCCSRIKAWEQSRKHARRMDVDSWHVPAVVGQTARVLERIGDMLFPVERGER